MSSQAYIKNMGSTQTFIKRPNEIERFNDIHWEADYDGEQANIHLNIDDNGNNSEIRAKLDNNNLAQLLNIPSIRGDLDERLRADFSKAEQPSIIFMKSPPIIPREPEPLRPKLRFQPFLRPQKKTRKLRRKYNKLPKEFKEPKESELTLVGKTAALNYRTPLPRTMRIHLTSDSKGGRSRKSINKRSLKRTGKRISR
jgi:hypothetical protein